MEAHAIASEPRDFSGLRRRRRSGILPCVVAGARREQLELCERLGTAPQFVYGVDKLGVARAVLANARPDPLWPVQGVRCRPSGDTCGWFLWAGDYSTDPNFFVPSTVLEVIAARPEISHYLGLPPGWGFIFAPGYEDVWPDEKLLV
jgi:hypothetical protein